MSTVLEEPPAESTLLTADELLLMPDGERYELVDGQLVERDMGALSGWVGNTVATELNLYARQHGGWAFGDGVGYRCYADDPERVRKPDASFVRADRLPSPPEGYNTIAPDLAVEVVSPNDIYYEVESKVDEYLAAGVRLVWVVNPVNKTVRVFQPGRIVCEFGPDDELTGGDVMPGFTCRVRSLFPSLPKPAG
jgi:Uma2 family endonuclease